MIMEQKLTMGIIGFGKSTMRYHLPYLFMRPNIEVKTIYSRSYKPLMEQNYKDTGITFTNDLNHLLEDPSIQMVSVITSADSHYSLAKQVLLAGKHVLVEKPFTSSLAEAKELLDLAKSKNLLIMPFQNRRFDGDFLATKLVLDKQILGRLIEIESHYDYFRESNTVVHNSALENSFVYGHAVHLVDRLVSLFGRPSKVFYDVRNIRVGEGADDYHDIHLFYEHTGSGTFKAIVKSSHLVKTPYPQFLVHGSRGSFVKYGIDMQEYDLKAGIMPHEDGFGADNTYNYGKLEYLNQNGDTIKRELKTPLGDYGRIYDHLYESIIHGEDKLISDEQILSVMEIMERAFEKKGPHVVELLPLK